MGEHLSALALDRLAAELPVDLSTSSHLTACAACRARLEAVKAERAALLQGPRFNALLSQLESAAAPRKPIPRWTPVLIALAATLLVLVGTRFLPREDGTILKGNPTVELLKDGATPVSQARVGDRLSLAVGGAGQQAVAAFFVDEAGEVSVLLPSTPLTAGARVKVGTAFEVTAGSLAVFACFGAPPLAVEALQAELRSRAAQSQLEAAAPAGCAKTRLEVLR